ncbi:hypothetical protein [Acinetobacter schindleri]|uniref:hypothetical protein n=1 Tax=Acinetobacter schindleri TaxID=108981 RepID=UPI0021CD80EA|nr:hypothetical protein [Acinetobacter schindleri]MCU4322189.1 hypothetical protein [Acinetobacter schindleri]
MSDFITDVERQYELYCKIAEEHGFIDLDAKKNGFRCTTKSNEFNAGWIAFVGAVAAVRDEQQTIIDDLKAQLNNMEACYIEKKKQVETVSHMLEGDLKYVEQDRRGNFDFLQMAMIRCLGDAIKALRGGHE